jgi:single-stranded-DNA-specific exonuclease
MTLHALTEQILNQKGIPQIEWEDFLNPKYELLGNPFLMAGLESGAVRLFEAIDHNEKVIIYSDYDCDGVPAAAMFDDLFQKINFQNYEIYIPDRHEEGYGLHREAIDGFIENGVKLILTLDLGITAHEEVIHASTHGIDVIVTDHHLPKTHEDGSDNLPKAYVVINPKRSDCKYPEKMLCGAGVGFTFIRGFLEKYREYFKVPVGFEKWSLDLVGIATLSDMVPLVGENRILASFGLKVIRQTKRFGLQELFHDAGVETFRVTEDDIGFTLAPRLNAASRMESPKFAYNLLAAKNMKDGKEAAIHLGSLNDSRKSEVARIMKEVYKKMEGREINKVVVIGDKSWRVGVLGLVATKIVEAYKVPAFVWGQEGGTQIKGSCRSDGNTHLVTLMTSLSTDTISNFGGHIGAGGFTLTDGGIFSLEEELIAVVDEHRIESVESDKKGIVVSLKNFGDEMYNAVNILAPFGFEFEKPQFIFQDATLVSFRNFGKEKNHLEIIISNGKKDIKAIQFFKTVESYEGKFVVGESISILGFIEESWFLRKRELRIRIADIV